MSDLVLREDAGGIALLTLNRPEQLNALTTALFRQLDAHVRAIETDTTICCVVLRGGGRAFSAGRDLDDFIPDGDAQSEHSYFSHIIERLARLSKAVIAAVHGPCCTRALELGLAADIILASDSAVFADTHAKFALIPLWGMSQQLPCRIGMARVREMIFTACAISAGEALAISPVNHVYPDELFGDEVKVFARSI